MPPRPGGTDGADHSYREVIVERYKRMADFKDSINKLMGLHLVFVFIKVAWSFAVFRMGGPALPNYVLGLIAGELLLQVLLYSAKLGQSKESLRLLKTFNSCQALLTATQLLNAWQYHQGTQTEGIPTYDNSVVAAAYIGSTYPQFAPGNLLDLCKAFEMFVDLVTTVFMVMATVVSHKMIVEKMQMKAEKGKVSARKGAIKGGDSDDDSDDGSEGSGDDGKGVPQAVPISQEKPKVVAKASASMRRRHA